MRLSLIHISHAGIAVGDTSVTPVEQTVKWGKESLPARIPGFQQQGAQGRGKRQRIKGGNEHGNGDGHGLSLIHI